MLYRKTGFPEESEIVICNVTNIHYNSVFVSLMEYGRQGMIHISEISPGRIRNIRDYVKEGKVIICKVLRVNKEKGYIDLSLRRVNESQRREKVNQIKQEQKAERIIEYVAQQFNQKPLDLYKKIADIIFVDYEFIHHFFEDVVAGEETLDILKLDADITKELDAVIHQRIKPKEYEIKAIIRLSSYASEGVEIVRKALTMLEEQGARVFYLGAGKYHLEISGPDIKELKQFIGKLESDLKTFCSDNNALCELTLVEE